MNHFVVMTTAILGLTIGSATAQNAALTQVGKGFAPIGSSFFLNQADGINVAGIVQTSNLADAEVIQTGFYNRAVIAQSGTDPIATIDQLGDFNRSLILQLTGATDALTLQSGLYNTAIVLQTGATANTSNVNQNGIQNSAVQFQDGATVFTLSGADLEQLAENFLFAPETARAGAELINLDAIAFADTLFGHLDARRGVQCAEIPIDIKTDPADRPLACDALRVWAQVGYSGGSQNDRLGAFGFDYDAGSVLVAGEYQATPDFVGGIALRYARTGGDVSHGLADLDLDSYGGAVYGDFNRNNVFVSAAVLASYNALDIKRPGFSDAVSANPDGRTYGAAIETGYFFGESTLQVGPIAGLSYAKTDVDGYDEGGAFLLNQSVPAQDADSLLGMAGLRFAVERDFGGSHLKAHADIGYEHDFNDDRFEILQTRFEFAPNAAILTPVGGLGEQDYLKLAGGLSLELAANTELNISAAGRIAGQDRSTFNVSSALNHRF